MNITKHIIDRRINNIIEENQYLFNEFGDNERKRSQAFLLLGISSYLNIEIAEAVEYITDGGYDGGLDAVYLNQQGDGRLDVILFQSKYTRDLEKDSNFPANSVEKAVWTIQCIFDCSREYNQLNEKIRSKVAEIQSLILDGNIPYVTFVMVNNGLPWTQEGQNHIDNAFKNQRQVEFKHWNHDDIIKYVDKAEDIDSNLQFTGTSIQQDFNYKRVIIGRVHIEEIYNLMEKYGDNLLEKNIRKFLGINAINREIRETLLNDDKKHNFFFYNNGITMICEEFRHNALQKENWLVQTKKLQIINGGQTCKTIYQTMQDNKDKDFSDITVLVRLYAVGDDEDIINGVTLATNNQNPVDMRDLKANNEKQLLLEKDAEGLGYKYKRKRDNQANIENVIPSSVAAEAVFAIWRRKPHLAKYKKSEFFNEFYDEIFNDLNASQMIIAVLIHRYCDSYRKKFSDNQDIQSQRAYSGFLLSALIGRNLLSKCNITLEQLNHSNFNKVREYFENNKENIYQEEEARLIDFLKTYIQTPIQETDGRTMAAVFRRFEFINGILQD